MSPMAAAVVVLTAVYLTLTTNACMETAWSGGYLSPDVAIEALSLTSHGGTSCHCCALCYQNPDCASLSHNAGTGECRMYGVVAGYDTLTRDDGWKYLVIPGRSQHQQFCRHHSDCQVKGDSCRGRVCTDLVTVTCRVILETFGARNRFGTWSLMHGWIDGRAQMLTCMYQGELGFTRLFKNTKGVKLTQQNVSRFNDYPTNPSASSSILYLADEIRRAGDETTYQMLYRAGTGLVVSFDAIPRQTPVMTDEPRKEPWGKVTSNAAQPDLEAVSLPFYVTDGNNLILVNVMERGGSEDSRSVARNDGKFWYNQLDKINVFIRE